MKYLVVVLLLLAPIASAWEEDCQSGQCRVYTYTDVSQRGSSSPARMFLEITSSNVVAVTALNTRAYHARFYTTKPATHVRLQQKDYVPSKSYFNMRLPGIITVDGRRVAALHARNESQLKSQAVDVDTIIQAFKPGTSATVEYASSLYGKGQKVTFSLMGFTKSYDSLSLVIASPSRVEMQEMDPFSVLGPLLDGNRFAVSVGDLSLTRNPHGSGVFVYASKTRYSGVERLFLWFVHGGTALKLNGATHNLTPSLTFPREASLDLWEGTGMSPSNVTATGLKLSFGR